MSAQPLTRRQREVLQAIYRALVEDGLAPTLEELGQSFGINRVSIYGHVKALIKKGYLENLTPGASRSLALTSLGRDFLEPALPFDIPSASEPASPASSDEPDTRTIPLLGRIAAGTPMEAVEDPERVALDDFLGVADNHYLLEVRGDSMIEDNIQEGDLVVVHRDKMPHDGDIVVAILEDEEATLKRLYREEKVGGWRLQPANATLEPRFVQELEVRGVVTGVVRRV